jgi:hypothetical protein
MTRNITLRIDDAIIRKCRYAAGEENKSGARWVMDLILNTLNRKERYPAARRQVLKYLEKGFRLGGKPLSRDEAHEG